MKLGSILNEIKSQKRSLESIPVDVQNFVSDWVVGQYSAVNFTPKIQKWFKDNGYQLSQPTTLYRGVPGEAYHREKKPSRMQSWTRSLSAAAYFATDEASGEPRDGIIYQAQVSPEESIADLQKFIKSIDMEAQYHLGVDGSEGESEVLTKFIPQNRVTVKKKVRAR